MSRSASMTTTLDSLRPIAPPALPRNAFFSERALASKMGNSTHALCVSMCGTTEPAPTRNSEVLPGSRLRRAPAHCHARRQRPLPAHLLQLLTRGHLLGEQCGLDAVEQALEPADELGLGDAQFGVRRHGVLGERQREALELLAKLGCQPV